MHIERLHPHDPLSELDIGSINQLLRQLSSTAVSRSREEICRSIASAEVHIVRSEDGQIAGIASLFTLHKLVATEGLVEDVVIDERHRGQRLGEQLMDALIDRARELRLVHLNLTSSPRRIAANALYQKLGFVPRTTNVYRLLL